MGTHAVKIMKKNIPFLFFAFVLISCQSELDESYKAELYESEFFHRSMKKLTDIMVYDILSPPVATRNYTYPTVAAYEIMAQANPDYQSLAGQLHGLEPIEPYETTSHTDPYLAALEAFMILSQKMVFSEDLMEEYRRGIASEWKQMGIPGPVLRDSKSYAQKVANHIVQWMATDRYKETRTMPKFPITADPGRWQPTPPGYIDGIEPHWNKIRTMVLPEAEQFAPPPPPAFDTVPGSDFYEAAMEVYHTVQAEDKKCIEIASFWDCNPFVIHNQGHVHFGTKKISPGGHWIGITSLAAKKSNLDPMETINAYTWVTIGLWDSFISCWDEKYRSNLIRPETYINRHIDPFWRPVLQTPPFPEHTSGHSVVSQASAVILTALFGDNFEYEDTVEVEYGLPARHFTSFLQAADEAAISRLYGGIHYKAAIEYGVQQGAQIGNFILKNLETKRGSVAFSY